MTFRFKNSNGDIKDVDVSIDIIFERCADEAYELLANCQCEPVGETNVVECNCYETVEDYDLIEAF